jgi:phenylalanyl-tRNA synthetase beta subunit
MIIASHDRTLTDGEVAKMLDDIAATAQQQFAAERV